MVQAAGRKYVQTWLIIGLVMVLGQVVIGGITRLTESGLSITEWEVVSGILPPMSQASWEAEFEAYKATPQYEKIHRGMSMADFKFIYFWEYFHRLWARIMGLVFAVPFAYFLYKRWLSKRLVRRLLIAVGLAGLAASFGWIMVASGLIERPWVNSYKLTMHLSIAVVLFGYLFWTTMLVIQPRIPVINNRLLKNGIVGILVLLGAQIILGGMMSGMKAALAYPTWPDMNGVAIPDILFNSTFWTWENIVEYDASPLMPALVQTLHRGTAYALTIMVLWYAWKALKSNLPTRLRGGTYALLGMTGLQVLLGILTVINSTGEVPVDLGVYHQAGAFIMLAIVLFNWYQFYYSKNVENSVDNPNVKMASPTLRPIEVQ